MHNSTHIALHTVHSLYIAVRLLSLPPLVLTLEIQGWADGGSVGRMVAAEHVDLTSSLHHLHKARCVAHNLYCSVPR